MLATLMIPSLCLEWQQEPAGTFKVPSAWSGLFPPSSPSRVAVLLSAGQGAVSPSSSCHRFSEAAALPGVAFLTCPSPPAGAVPPRVRDPALACAELVEVRRQPAPAALEGSAAWWCQPPVCWLMGRAGGGENRRADLTGGDLGGHPVQLSPSSEESRLTHVLTHPLGRPLQCGCPFSEEVPPSIQSQPRLVQLENLSSSPAAAIEEKRLPPPASLQAVWVQGGLQDFAPVLGSAAVMVAVVTCCLF